MREIAYVVRGFLTVRRDSLRVPFVPLRSKPLFTGCGWITPLVNLLIAGSGNAVIIDLIPRAR